MWPVGVTKKGKKGQKLSCVKLAICPDHPRRHRPLKFCMRGRVREVVIYFKFHENRSRGIGAVGGRKSPSPIDKAHGLYNSLYYRTSRDNNNEYICIARNRKSSDGDKTLLLCTFTYPRWPWPLDPTAWYYNGVAIENKELLELYERVHGQTDDGKTCNTHWHCLTLTRRSHAINFKCIVFLIYIC